MKDLKYNPWKKRCFSSTTKSSSKMSDSPSKVSVSKSEGVEEKKHNSTKSRSISKTHFIRSHSKIRRRSRSRSNNRNHRDRDSRNSSEKYYDEKFLKLGK